jgi:hypothetical protein
MLALQLVLSLLCDQSRPKVSNPVFFIKNNLIINYVHTLSLRMGWSE